MVAVILFRMALTHNHLRSLAGTSFTKAVRVRCASMRQVAISNWNKTASAGFKA
jgi:hypothetical protein